MCALPEGNSPSGLWNNGPNGLEWDQWPSTQFGYTVLWWFDGYEIDTVGSGNNGNWMLVTFDVNFEEILFQIPKSSFFGVLVELFSDCSSKLWSLFLFPLICTGRQTSWIESPYATGKLILHWRAVTTPVLIAPCRNWAVWDGGSKCATCSLNRLELMEVFTVRSASAAPVSVAPCHDWSILQYCSICTLCGLNTLHISESRTAELSPPPSAAPHVTTDLSARIAANADAVAWICSTFLSWSWTVELSLTLLAAPCHNWTIWQHGCKCAPRSLNLLHTPFATKTWGSPCDNKSICPDRSKGAIGSLKLPDTPDLILDCRAVTIGWIAPRNNRNVCQNCRKCMQMRHLWPESAAHSWGGDGLPRCSHPTVDCPTQQPIICHNCSKRATCRLNVESCTFLSWSFTCRLSPPWSALPQAITDPSARMAANAQSVAWIFCTLPSSVWTFELSPPEAREPHATANPFARIAAKAQLVAWSCCTFLSEPQTFELSPPYLAEHRVTILSPPRHHNAKARSVAASFTSNTTAGGLHVETLHRVFCWISQEVTLWSNQPQESLSKRLLWKFQFARWARPPISAASSERGKRSLEPDCEGS